MTLIGKSASEVEKLVQEAVKIAKQDGAKILEETKGAHQLEIAALKGKSAKEISEITSAKDIAEFNTKQAQQKIGILEQAKVKGEELLNKTQDKLKKALTPKVAEQQLSTGNKLIRKVNKNGAKMTTEVTAEGKKVSCTVETLDGMVKKTTYDPTTGKPIKTFANSSGKNIETKYDQQGYSKKPSEINVKKPKIDKAYALAPTNKEISGDFIKVTTPYSDGSKVIKTTNKNTNKLVEELHFKPGSNQIHKEIRIDDDVIQTYTKNDEFVFGHSDINLKYKNGTVVDIKPSENELGVKLSTRTTKFGKETNTNIKAQKQVYTKENSYSTLINEERRLKNGDIVKIKIDPTAQTKQGNAAMFHNYKVEGIEIKSKTGEIKKLDRDEALKYLQENEAPHVPNENSWDKTKKHNYV